MLDNVVLHKMISCLKRGLAVATLDNFPTLDEVLAQRGLSQTALAVLGDIDPATASRIIRGLGDPKPQTVLKLARALGMSPIRLRRIIQRTQQVAQRGELREAAL